MMLRGGSGAEYFGSRTHHTTWHWIWTLLVISATSILTFAADKKTAVDYFVTSLPGQPEGDLLRQYAGDIEVAPEHHGNLWFWRFENRHLANKHRTVLWLNGGPGCSSLDGALMEIGPYRLKDEEHLMYNNGSWDEFANLLFVDNPVGTGFSHVDTDSYVHDLGQMAENMVLFLEEYFRIFPGEVLNDLYIAGESYAGQHIPYIARAILDHNVNMKSNWNLKGLLIGNGWISPQDQSPTYLEMAYKAGIVEKGSAQAQPIEAQQAQCHAELERWKNDQKVSYPDCEAVLRAIFAVSRDTVPGGGRCLNMYDVRLADTYPSCGMNWPPDLEYLKRYLRRPDVLKALHVGEEKKTGWIECNNQVGSAFDAKKSKPSIELMPKLIEEIPVLLFSGDQDLICDHLGTEALIHNMEWSGGKGFETSPGTWAPRRDWVFEGEPAGIYQNARNLTYVLFYNSSHMVPFDYPRRTRDMLDRFMGVDIASIGGTPADSRIDGEKAGLETSVGGHPNSTSAEQETQAKVDKAKWSAYYRSGAIALVVVSILAGFFGWYVWQDRRRRAGYSNVLGGSGGLMDGGKYSDSAVMRRDVEATDFDENELEDLAAPKSGATKDHEGNHAVGGFSDNAEDEHEDAGGDERSNRYTNVRYPNGA